MIVNVVKGYENDEPYTGPRLPKYVLTEEGKRYVSGAYAKAESNAQKIQRLEAELREAKQKIEELEEELDCLKSPGIYME